QVIRILKKLIPAIISGKNLNSPDKFINIIKQENPERIYRFVGWKNWEDWLRGASIPGFGNIVENPLLKLSVIL
ncbi:MAG: hypothetical protein KAJ15_03685, partial [Spirochaetes bacterium]|nr:hypothetical protein [Spirochaetota bacterium]